LWVRYLVLLLDRHCVSLLFLKRNIGIAWWNLQYFLLFWGHAAPGQRSHGWYLSRDWSCLLQWIFLLWRSGGLGKISHVWHLSWYHMLFAISLPQKSWLERISLGCLLLWIFNLLPLILDRIGIFLFVFALTHKQVFEYQLLNLFGLALDKPLKSLTCDLPMHWNAVVTGRMRNVLNFFSG